MGFVLNETVNKLTPDGPFMNNVEFIFLVSLPPFERLFKDFFYVITI